MPVWSENPRVRRYGVFAGPALFAPVMALATVVMAVLTAAFAWGALTSDVEVVGRGEAGELFALEQRERMPRVLLSTDAPGVAPENVSCQVWRASQPEPLRFATEPPSGEAFTLNGTTWYPVATATRLLDGPSVACSGPGVRTVIATVDERGTSWLVVAFAGFGTLAAAALTALGFRMRRD